MAKPLLISPYSIKYKDKMFVTHPLVKQDTVKLRRYQEAIVARAIDANTLVVLPTGLGKTLIAAMISAHRLQNFPDSTVLFLAPTRPLAVQHHRTFERIIDVSNMVVLTGMDAISKRSELWKNNRIIFATPQTIENDIMRGLNLEDVSLVVFDECVSGDTKIRLADGRVMVITDIISELTKNPDKKIYVETINEKTGDLEPQRILKCHKIKSEKRMVEIESENQKIKVTENHLFLVNRNRKSRWIEAGKLKVNDRVAIKHNNLKKEKYSGKVIVTEKDIERTYKKEQQKFAGLYKKAIRIRGKTHSGARTISKELRISEGTIRNWINNPHIIPKAVKIIKKLEEKALLPFRYSSPGLKIITRIIGHIFGDGWLCLKDNEPKIIGFSGRIEDLKRIQQDLNVIGIKYSSITSRKTKSIINPVNGKEISVIGTSNSFIVSDAAFVRLIFALGTPSGNKTDKSFSIPKWLFNTPKEIKKEFLSALMGSEGYIPRVRKGTRSPAVIRLHFNKLKKLKRNGLEYAKQILKLFNEFGVEINIKTEKGNVRKNGEETIKFKLTLSNSNEQLKRFLRDINYTYNIEKRMEANLLLKYLEYKEDDMKQREILYQKVQKLHNEGLGARKISRLLYVNEGSIEGWLYSNRKPKFASPFVSSYENWKVEKNDIISVDWAKIKEIKNSQKEDYVYDLTVEENHNYIGNNFVIHNCHRSVGNYSYVYISQRYMKMAKNPLILGLTASPSSDDETVKEICRNLFIRQVEIKTEHDVDVKPYIQEVNVEWIKVELPEEFRRVKSMTEDIFRDYAKELKNYDYLKTANINKINKRTLLQIQSDIRNEIIKGVDSYVPASIVAGAIKINHALELLETQGISSLNSYLERLQKQKSITVRKLFSDERMKNLVKIVHDLNVLNVDHPKLDEVVNLVKKHKDEKILIFTQYRDSVEKIIEKLNENDILAHEFIGQAQKGGKKGMTQKEQIKTLENFREGKYNVLTCTSVAEEGLDIPKVDLVIFYEAIPSEIRTIQRRGRTGRSSAGRVVVLMAKNTRDEGYYWASVHKERKMGDIMRKMRGKFEEEGQQSLVRYSSGNSDDVKKETGIKIFADVRERNPEILRILSEKAKIELKQLEVGDFILSDRVVVERKIIPDFVQSIIDKRLLEQASNLSRNFEIPIMIIEGNEDIYSLRDIHPNAIRGALASLAIDFGISVIPSRDEEDTALFLYMIAKREQIDEKREIALRGERKPFSMEEMQRYVIESLPNISAVLAKRLLEHFGSVRRIINATEKDLMEVDGIGEIKAREIVKIAMGPYRSS